MPHHIRHHAIVLRTIDIGESDRLCILLSKEHGRTAARARGVRKVQSKMGATLLAFRSVIVDIHNGKGSTIISAVPQEYSALPTEFHAFVRLQQAADLILSFTHEEEPLPEIYQLLIEQLHYSSAEQINTIPAFTLRLLHLLGLLPTTIDDARFRRLPSDIQQYIAIVPDHEHIAELCCKECYHPSIQLFIDAIVTAELNRPLKSTEVVQNLRTEWATPSP